MRSNSSGGVVVILDEEMRRFDNAPPELRWLLRNASLDFGVASVVERYSRELSRAFGRGDTTARSALAVVAARMVDVTAANTRRTYGPDHPQAGSGR